MSIFVLNIATMLGLALAIDYSLFIVSRFREELRRGRTVDEAVERAVATAGKAVAFSGVAVAIGLSGLLLFEAPAIRSIGIAGALVVLCSVVFALTFLPADPRDARPPRQRAVAERSPPPIPAGRRRRRAGPHRALGARRARGHAPADRGPRSRRLPSCSSSAARSCASSRACPAPRSTRPASRAATRTSRSRPSSRRARRRRSSSSPTSPGSPTDARQHQGPRRLRRTGRRRSTGIDRVESPFTIHDPTTGARADARTGRRALRPARRPATGRSRGPPRAVRPRLARSGSTPSARSRRRARRRPTSSRSSGRSRPGTGITTQVGGSAASGHDFLVSQARARAVRGRADPPRQRLHPVPAVRVGRASRSRPSS